MKSFRPFPHRFLARALLPVMLGGLAASLVGCGRSGGDESPAKTSASKAAKSKATASKAADSTNGMVLKGDGLSLEANAGTAMLNGYSPHPLSVRIMGGWVNQDTAKRSNQETDEAAKRKLAMASFGMLTINIAAGKAEPGTYPLVPKGKDPQTGTVVIDEDKGAGLAGDYTSQSGTLTIKSVVMNDSGTAVAGVEGSFDGQFSSDAGDSRAFSGSFRYAPKR